MSFSSIVGLAASIFCPRGPVSAATCPPDSEFQLAVLFALGYNVSIMLSGIARIRNIRMHAAEPECEQVPVNSGAIFGLSYVFRFSHLKYVVYIVTVLIMLGVHGISLAQNSNSKVVAEKLEMFNFEEVKATNPNQITPRKWNWEIKLSPEQSKRRFQIVQETVGKNGPESTFSQVLFTEKDLQKSLGDIVHFKLHTGDENPTVNMNNKGNVGLGVSFSRVAGGYGSSSWIVLPGKIVKSAVHEQRFLTKGELILISFETVDSVGNKYMTDLKLAESR